MKTILQRPLPGRRHPPTWLPLLLIPILLVGCIGHRWEVFPPLTEDHPRILFFALDAVPFDLVERLTDPALGDDRLFAGYSRPTPLVSSFPATSSLAFTGLLEPFELERPPGYEAKFFDRDANRIRGGGLVSYRKISFGWREFFTWRYGDPVKRALASARPVKGAVREVEWGLARFAEADDPEFHAYSALTDAVAHLEGPEGLIPALRALDAGIHRLRTQNPERKFHAVIYSDHGIAGGEPLDNVREPVQQALTAAGFTLSSRLLTRRDAVMVPFGLVSSFEVYVQHGRGEEVARILGPVPGVDLCVARQSNGAGEPPWHENRYVVAGDAGQALLLRRSMPGATASAPQRTLWAYRPQEGADPLAYQSVVETLEERAARESEHLELPAGWYPDTWWLEASADHLYPDAPYRLASTFDLVTHTASTVCSVAPGHMYGAWTTDLAARLSGGRLEWTHGALTRQSSLGFLLTDLPGWQAPEVMRFDEALDPFVEHLSGGGEGEVAHRRRPGHSEHGHGPPVHGF